MELALVEPSVLGSRTALRNLNVLLTSLRSSSSPTATQTGIRIAGAYSTGSILDMTLSTSSSVVVWVMYMKRSLNVGLAVWKIENSRGSSHVMATATAA
jgi:hypothetical protein